MFSRLRTTYRNLKLKNKILMYNAVIVLMITVAFSFFATELVESQIIGRYGEQNADSLGILSDFLEELETLVTGKFYRLEESVDARLLLDGDTSRQSAVGELLASLADDRYIDEIILYNTGGEVAANWGARRPMSIAGQLLSGILENGRELYWYNSKYSNSNNVETLSVYRTFRTDRDSLGVMYIRLNTSEIADVYSMIGSNVGAGIYLLNGRGSLILPKNRGSELLGLCKERLNAYQGDSQRPVKVSAGGENYLVYETFFQKYDVFAICVTRYEDVANEVALFRRLVILLGVVCLALVLIYSLWMADWVAKPIVRLASDMKKVRGGDLSLRMEYDSRDEIGMLAQSFNSTLDRLVALMAENERTQQQKRELEMTALQMQITPHFLYNSLESLSALALIGDDQTTYVMANALSMFYRGVLSDGRSIVSIREEIEIVRNYLEVQSIRYRDVFSYEIDVDEALMDGGIVKLSLQPLVENAIYHGVRGIRWHGVIRILGSLEDGRAVFSVIDNGKGMARESVERFADEQQEGGGSRRGFGMSSVDERLKLFYGSDFGLRIVDVPQGTHIQLTLPFRPLEDKL